MTYRRTDYVTERARMVQGPLESPLEPLRSYAQELARLAVIAAGVACLWLLAGIFA